MDPIRRERIFQVLWTIEIAVGILPALLALGYIFMFILLAIWASLAGASGEGLLGNLLFLACATGIVVAGGAGLFAIVMAYRSEGLQDNLEQRRRACWFAVAGIIVDILMILLVITGAHDQPWKWNSFTIFAIWAIAGPLIAGGHAAYRVFAPLRVTGTK